MGKDVFELFEMLEHKKESLLQDLVKEPKENLMTKEAEGKWSVHQVLLHLISSEKGSLGYLKKKSKSTNLKKINISARFRYSLLNTALKLPIKFKMPSVLSAPKNDVSFDEIILEYSNCRKELKAFLNENSKLYTDKLVFRHPIAGRLSLKQAIQFMNDHFDHHLKQIDRILKSVR
ncbi:MAG: DinB family protein [Reichenbachiella sp.]